MPRVFTALDVCIVACGMVILGIIVGHFLTVCPIPI